MQNRTFNSEKTVNHFGRYTKNGYSEKQTENPFEYYAKNDYLIILDTCSLMDAGFDRDLSNNLKIALKKYHRKVYIPNKVTKEIDKHSQNSKMMQDARRANAIINFLIKDGLVSFPKGSAIGDQVRKSTFADAEIQSIVAGNMADKNILLITQDKGLAKDIIGLKHSKSIVSKKIYVKYICNGKLFERGIKDFFINQKFGFGNRGNNANGFAKNTQDQSAAQMINAVIDRKNIKTSSDPKILELKKLLKEEVKSWRNGKITRVAQEYSIETNEDSLVNALIASLSANELANILSKINIKKTCPPLEKAASMDEKVKLTATLEKGDGRYKKGFIKKEPMLNFKLSVNIDDRHHALKIVKVVAIIKGKNKQKQEKLPTKFQSVTSFDLPVNDYGGHIEATVFVTYKIGRRRDKEISATVSKNF